MSLARSVYQVTAAFPKSEMYGLSAQMRRAAVSVPSNIAEGQGLGTDKQFASSLFHARGSLYELHTQIELAAAFAYMEPKSCAGMADECDEVARMLNALLRTVKAA